MLRIRFLGGVGTVTGSKFLVETEDKNILVDCGLFQGLKELRLQNWQPLQVPTANIDLILLTHAHLDHSGYIPLLYKNGFRGKVFCTSPTRDLARIILLDNARLQMEDAGLANKMGYSKHAPAKPLYETRDVLSALNYFVTVDNRSWQKLEGGIKFRFSPSGHILGSSFIELDYKGKRLVFSGDLGRQKPLTLPAPTKLEKADYLVIESTYGSQLHSSIPPLVELSRIVNETIDRKGHLIIPSFAVGRTQDLLYLLTTLKRQKKIPHIPIYVDSPMGISATEVLINYPQWHKLKNDDIRFIQEHSSLVRTQKQSRDLLEKRTSTIVIAGSGMAAGGRVLHHLAKRLPDERNTVLLVGFQAAGSRGKLLKERSPEVKIHGQYIPVRARIEELTSLSAHADQSEILTWLKHFKSGPKNVFIVHGEPHASDTLRLKIKDTLGWYCTIPKMGEEFPLN